jgi:hypothetical protein
MTVRGSSDVLDRILNVHESRRNGRLRVLASRLLQHDSYLHHHSYCVARARPLALLI